MNKIYYNFAKVWEALKELDKGTYSGTSDAYKLDIQCVNFTMTDEEIKNLKGYFYCYFPLEDIVFKDLWLQGQLNVTLTGTSDRSFDILIGIEDLFSVSTSSSIETDNETGDSRIIVGEASVTLNNTKYSDVDLIGSTRSFFETFGSSQDFLAAPRYELIFMPLYNTYEDDVYTGPKSGQKNIKVTPEP